MLGPSSARERYINLIVRKRRSCAQRVDQESRWKCYINLGADCPPLRHFVGICLQNFLTFCTVSLRLKCAERMDG